MNVEVLAGTYPEDVAGMVLLDPLPLSFILGEEYTQLYSMAARMTDEWQGIADRGMQSEDEQARAEGRLFQMLASEHREMFSASAQQATSTVSFGNEVECLMHGPLASKILTANSQILVNRNLDAVAESFAPDYVAHLTDRDTGHDGMRRFIAMLHSAFPDLEIEVDVLLEGEDRVAWQRTLRGTQRGDFMGFPGSDRHIVWRDMATSRFNEGVIAEEWVITDLAEQLLRARKGEGTSA